MDPVSEAPASFEFGRFRVLPQRREVLVDGRSLWNSAGALSMCSWRSSRPTGGGQQGRADEPGLAGPDRRGHSLHAQIKALRKAFSDHDLIRTVVGRGYQFKGDVHAHRAGHSERSEPRKASEISGSPLASTNLPAPTSDLVGRDAEIVEVIGL